jgi:hypothetical protein
MRAMPLLLFFLALPALGQSALPPCNTFFAVSAWTNCQGTATWANGEKYVGEWRDGKKNGQGTYTHANGDKYVGEFMDGKRHGQGIQTLANGNKYVGEFREDKPHGQGTFTFANGNKYVGQVRDNKYHGQGTYTFASGNKYVGEFRLSKPHGQGTHFASGHKYVGEFMDGKYHGQGTFYSLADNQFKGDKYVGEFRDDKRNGQGIYTFADGRPPQEGIWEDHKFVRAQRIPDHIAGRSPATNSEPQITPDKASSSDVSQTAPRVPIPGLDAIKAKCAELGFKAGTEKFGDCVLKLSK